MLKNYFYFCIAFVALFFCSSCAITSKMPELARKTTVITNISYMEAPSGIVQVVECEDGHVAYLKTRALSVDDIGSEYTYFYPAELTNTKNNKEFLECDILSIREEGRELISKLIVTYEDNTTEYYDLFLPGYMYEEISTTGQFSLTEKEFLSILSYNIKNNKIEG